MELFNLVSAFLQVGLFSFGGGYAALPIIQNQLINVHKWMNVTEFSDVVTLSQMTPGPLSINAATFVGMRQEGIIGAIVATYAMVIPSIILCIIMSYFYYKYRDLSSVSRVLKILRGTVVGLILVGGVQLMQSSLFVGFDIKAYVIFIVIAFIIFKYKVDSIVSIMLSGVLGFILFYLI